MGKYNVNINMNNKNSSQTLVLEQVEPGSFVLECGCASGYMTRYMKEKLGCTVDVIDIDPNDIDKAEQYANDAYLGDLDSWLWASHFRCNRYDYILFADVIEHLKHPKETLQMARQLLKDTGKIIISIPNICHNDVILQMFNNHFRYTELGLLDRTHIRFWGVEDFADFVNEIGFKITDTKTVVMPTQGTEQRLPFRMNEELMNLLRKRENGEVYQWVFTCEKR